MMDKARKSTRYLQQADNRLAAVLVSPTALVLVLVIGYPIIAAVINSTYGSAGLDPETGFISDTAPFVGLKNYTDALTGARFWNAFWNTSFFAATSVFLETVIGTAMALVMHRAMRGRGVVRAAILVPWAIPTVVSALLWRWIFNAEGIANSLLGQHILWTAEGAAGQATIIIADVWKTAPFIGLLVLAGLQIIPEEVFEAAKVDGANAWRRFVAITLPLVRPALLVAVLFRLLDAMRMFDLPYVLIGPRKEFAETLSMVAQESAVNVRYGAAAALALLLFLYIFAVAFAFIGLLGVNVFDEDRNQQRATIFKTIRERRRKHITRPRPIATSKSGVSR
jgi:multiple sugar transport system permease protein